jgi:hypothetical protein
MDQRVPYPGSEIGRLKISLPLLSFFFLSQLALRILSTFYLFSTRKSISQTARASEGKLAARNVFPSTHFSIALT